MANFMIISLTHQIEVILLYFFLPIVLFNLFRSVIRRFCAENVKGKVVLITGASSGIGEQLAYAYGKRGAVLVLVARREDALRQVAEMARRMGSPDVLVAPGDVTNADDCRQIIEKSVTRFGKLNHLVTNAGIGCFCPFQEAGDITRFNRIMDVNFWGSVYPTHYAVPHLRKSRGKIVVISSVAGRLPLPGSSFYSASKAAMTMFYEALRCELSGEVTITIVQPGWIKSELSDGKGMIKGGKEGVDQEMRDAAVGLFPVASAERCAEAIVKSACRGERTLIWPVWYQPSYLFRFLFPEATDLFLHRFHATKLSRRQEDYGACKH